MQMLDDKMQMYATGRLPESPNVCVQAIVRSGPHDQVPGKWSRIPSQPQEHLSRTPRAVVAGPLTLLPIRSRRRCPGSPNSRHFRGWKGEVMLSGVHCECLSRES